MGQVRNALRAYAAEGHSPTAVMRCANQLLVRLEPDAMATCCYLELHLAEGTATAVLAGHPAPVLRTGGHAYHPQLRTGPPLGVRGAEYVDSTFLVPTGSTLVLYTDGLVEDRRYPLDQGLADLCTAVRSAPTNDPQNLVEHILTAGVGPHPRRDDVAILALTVDAELPPGPRTARRRFRGDAAGAPAARRFAGDVLAAWGQDPLREHACVLLDEAITYAVRHTLGDLDVRITLGERLRIDVHDNSHEHPHIAETSAQPWGSTPLRGSGWFELDPATTRD
jgi:hypothetical protein